MVARDEVQRKARFFSTPEQLREWFERNHRTATELWIAYYKKGSSRRGVSYDEAVEEALCFGWIDGQVRSLDAVSYANRYTPRRPGSAWSTANIVRVKQLFAAGRMRPAGARALPQRGSSRNPIDDEDPPGRKLDGALLREFRRHDAAWSFFRTQAPSYRQTVARWILAARRPETRRRRLKLVIADSRSGRRVNRLSPGRNPEKD
jgi:uncharacterized protein YdeI (YjbR/CyaY-like superfamily)